MSCINPKCREGRVPVNQGEALAPCPDCRPMNKPDTDDMPELTGEYHADVNKLLAAISEAEAKYQELIMAVETKCHDESRHETALKYIKSCEHGATVHCAAGEAIKEQGE